MSGASSTQTDLPDDVISFLRAYAKVGCMTGTVWTPGTPTCGVCDTCQARRYLRKYVGPLSSSAASREQDGQTR